MVGLMAAKSAKNVQMLLVIACLQVLIPTRLAQLRPTVPGILPFPGQLPGQCWSSLVNIPGCLVEIYGSIFNGQFKIIGPTCCKAITEINDSCWPKLFPGFNPVIPTLLKNSCGSTSGGSSAPSPIGVIRKTNPSLAGPLPLIGLLPGQSAQDVVQCWSSLRNIQGCVSEIYGLLPKGQVGVIGPACCKAITVIKDNCWPKMFPFNPLFPQLLKSHCAPTPTGI